MSFEGVNISSKVSKVLPSSGWLFLLEGIHPQKALPNNPHPPGDDSAVSLLYKEHDQARELPILEQIPPSLLPNPSEKCHYRDGPDLEAPLLQNGDGDNEEMRKALPNPPEAPDLNAAESSPNLQQQGSGSSGKRSWSEWYNKSTFVPIACCIFLCFILKVVQQVNPVE